jgi:hypothetical protein
MDIWQIVANGSLCHRVLGFYASNKMVACIASFFDGYRPADALASHSVLRHACQRYHPARLV